MSEEKYTIYAGEVIDGLVGILAQVQDHRVFFIKSLQLYK